MNSRQRFLGALERQPIDRVPLFYQHLGAARHVLQSAGKTMREGFHNPEVFAQICTESWKLLGFDNVMAGWGDIVIEAQAHGTVWKFPERDFYPRVDRYGVQTPADADQLQAVDPMQDRFWSVPIKAARILQEKIGNEVAVVGCINSPAVSAMELRGYENMMLDLLTHPGAAHKMLQVLTESSKMYGDRIKEAGLDIVFLENGSAGGTQNSPELCDQFDMRYLNELCSYYKKLGLLTIVHNCSEMPYLEKELVIGPDAIHFNNDFVDLKGTYRLLKGRTCVMPGVNHQELLFKRTPDEVEAEVKRTIDLWGRDLGFIMAPGCELPFKTPLENLARFKEATCKYGTY